MLFNAKLRMKRSNEDIVAELWKGKRKFTDAVADAERREAEANFILTEISEEKNARIVRSVTSTNPDIVKVYKPLEGTKVTVRRIKLGRV